MEFRYTIDPNADEPIMMIDSHVGKDDVDPDTGQLIRGIDGSQWARELLSLDSMGKRRVKVYINSPGGSVSDGYSICSAMLHTKCKVDTYCKGIAASIAGVAFMCGRNRYMVDFGILMFHDPYGGSDNEALDKMKNSLATLIAARSGHTVETISAIMARTTFLDLSEALNLEMATDAEYSTENNIGRLSPIKNDSKKYWQLSKEILNSALNINNDTQKDTSMTLEIKKINNRLGLMEEASADSTMKAIETMQNSLKDAQNKSDESKKALKDKEEELAKMKSEMDAKNKELEDKYKNLHEEYIKMKAEVDASNQAAAQAKAAQNKIDAKNLIAEAVKLGKIENKAEAIAKWTSKAENDIDGVKDLLETMGVNVSAPDLSNVTTDGSAGKDGKKTWRETKNYSSIDDQAEHMRELVFDKMQKVSESNKRK